MQISRDCYAKEFFCFLESDVSMETRSPASQRRFDRYYHAKESFNLKYP